MPVSRILLCALMFVSVAISAAGQAIQLRVDLSDAPSGISITCA